MVIENQYRVPVAMTKWHRESRIYTMPFIVISQFLLLGMSPTEVQRNNVQELSQMRVEGALFQEKREIMASKIKKQVQKSGYKDQRRLRPIIDAIRDTPRHLFVPEDERAKAY
mgnify:FL=1|tara:strand:+ start:21766 stop:22104 length:339 start_codon:yes stop_codon:yes gene_type:complete